MDAGGGLGLWVREAQKTEWADLDPQIQHGNDVLPGSVLPISRVGVGPWMGVPDCEMAMIG